MNRSSRATAALRLGALLLLTLSSLLTVMPVPARQLWYLAIAVSEFSHIGIILALLFLLTGLRTRHFRLAGTLLSLLAFILFSSPLIRAAYIGQGLPARLEAAFGSRLRNKALPGPHREEPFSLMRRISGRPPGKVSFRQFRYTSAGGVPLDLRLYPARLPGLRPVLLVVHGGSWRSGSFEELPDVNNYFARGGYNVISINYRLAPGYKSPAQQEDIADALRWLHAHTAALNLNDRSIVLLGRSAGAQLALMATYTIPDPAIRGVIAFYGPADMPFGYRDPHNTWVLDPKKVLSDFIGGTPETNPAGYRKASPIAFVTLQTKPTLLVHGCIDAHVHHVESERLDAVLKANKVPHLLLSLPWATHGCEYSLNGPSGQLSVYAMERFLAAVNP